MDKTKEYIKMCGKAVEIQKQRVKSNGDFEVRFKNGVGTVEVYHHREITAHYKPENHLWLPRQDQLQEMVDWNDYQLTARFSEFVHFEAGCDNSLYKSMEQLWLAFVMSVKYDKVWKDDKWI